MSIKPEDMVKLRIFCPRSNLREAISELHKVKAMDIIEHQSLDGLDIGSPLPESTKISSLLVMARRSLYQVAMEPLRKLDYDELKPSDFEEAEREITEFDSETDKYFDRRKNLDSQLKTLREDQEKISLIEKMGIDPSVLKVSQHMTYYIGYVDDVNTVEEELGSRIKKNYEFIATVQDEKSLFVLFVEREKDDVAFEILRNHGFAEMKLPEEIESSDELKKRIEVKEKEREQAESQLQKLRQDKASRIAELENTLTHLSERADAPLMFGETKNVAIITGWVPRKRHTYLIRKLNEITGNTVFVEKLAIHKDDDVPVKLNHSKLFKPYEFLLRMFSLPSHKEIDPTIFVFFTFPLFFGFMLGDIGYGLLTLLLFIFLKKKMPHAKALLNIMIYCSVTTMIFGLIYGEFFGFEMGHWHFIQGLAHSLGIHHYPLFHRAPEAIMDLIVISLIVGAVHVNLGLLLGFINVWKQHGVKEAILEKAAWVILEIGVAVLALSALGMIPLSMIEGILIIIVAIAMLWSSEGIEGIVELPTLFIHIASYLRLMAIGIASVSLAVLVNEQTMPLFQKGPLFFLAAILLFGIGHTINIAMGIIGPFLHSLRLHYVEHFTKYYKGGGREFQPFGAGNE